LNPSFSWNANLSPAKNELHDSSMTWPSWNMWNSRVDAKWVDRCPPGNLNPVGKNKVSRNEKNEPFPFSVGKTKTFLASKHREVSIAIFVHQIATHFPSKHDQIDQGILPTKQAPVGIVAATQAVALQPCSS